MTGERVSRRPAIAAWLARWLPAAWLALAALCPTQPAAAHAHHATVSPVLSQCVAPVREGDDPAALLAMPSRFDCREATLRDARGNLWVRLAPPVPTAAPIFDFEAGWQRDATLWVRHDDGTIARVRLDNATLSSLTTFGRGTRVELPESAAPVSAILIRLDEAANLGGLMHQPHLQAAVMARADDVEEVAIYAGFGGICLALLVYNLVVWFSLRERFQLAYCAVLVAMAAVSYADSGGWSLVFPDGDFTIRLRLGQVAIGLVTILSFGFLRDFLETWATPRWLRRASLAARCLLATASIAVGVAPFAWLRQAHDAYLFAFAQVPVLTVMLIVAGMRRGSPAARVLALACAGPLLVGLTGMAHALGLIDIGGLFLHLNVIAMSLFALTTSTAMAFRVKTITRERDAARAEERVARQLAEIDPLTGLLNRRALLERTLAWGSDEPLRLLLIDIDHFKQVNDRHGHDHGDGVLRELAGLLAARAEIRASVARLGGEEFALIGTAAELPAGMALAILSDIRGHAFDGDLRLTVSIGMATGAVRDEAQWRKLYRRADRALYAAKTAGRNRVVDHATMALPDAAARTAAA
ncbi:MAG: GGDEF domain-containing protein [Sphingomonadales bacterium]|nr:GGDEF domain-containing protein [Sphingomonadales bacterium]